MFFASNSSFNLHRAKFLAAEHPSNAGFISANVAVTEYLTIPKRNALTQLRRSVTGSIKGGSSAARKVVSVINALRKTRNKRGRLREILNWSDSVLPGKQPIPRSFGRSKKRLITNVIS
jgi:hypothetical protein